MLDKSEKSASLTLWGEIISIYRVAIEHGTNWENPYCSFTVSPRIYWKLISIVNLLDEIDIQLRN